MLETIVIGALCVLGLYAAMGEGMILHWMEKALIHITDNKVLRPIRPALYECPVCMASIWGTTFWLVIGGSFGAAWVIYVFGVAGLNYVLSNVIDK